MFGLVKNLFAPKPNPIGVDFGSDSLRLAQVAFDGKEHRLIAAASADVPSHVRHNPAARLEFFVETTRDLLAQGGFRGRQAVLALPAASMFIQHLRIAKMDDEATTKALPWEARGKIPIDPSHALMRHIVAGEVFQDQDPRNEIILMAAGRELVENLLAAAARARLDVVGMTVEPQALVECFSHLYRRKADAGVVNLFVDIGCSATRAIVAQDQQILFARSIPVAGDHFNRAASAALKISFDDAKLLRIKLCHLQPALDQAAEASTAHSAPAPAAVDTTREADATDEPGTEQASFNAPGESFALLDAGLSQDRRRTDPLTPPVAPEQPAVSDEMKQFRAVEQACREPLTKLLEELDFCRRYHESTFPSKPINRIIFVGGEARHRTLCQHIAREMQLAAQLGDPITRLARSSDIGIESGIDRRQPQPGWAVTVGLSMGPPKGQQTAAA